MADDLQSVVRWLEHLREAAPAIQRAGLTTGANRAAARGLGTFSDGSSRLAVSLRRGVPVSDIPAAMSRGMTAEFERRVK